MREKLLKLLKYKFWGFKAGEERSLLISVEKQATEFDAEEGISDRGTMKRDSEEDKHVDIHGIRSSLVWWLHKKV